MAVVIDQDQWEAPAGSWNGEIELGQFGAEVSVIQIRSEEIGYGPRLHTHPYPEVFIIRQGRALYTIGDQRIEGVAGQILIVPAGTPHRFENLGPGVLESTDLHLSGKFITDWLE